MIINVLIILTASYATYIYGIFVAVFGALSILARPCLVDEELIQSRREDGWTTAVQKGIFMLAQR
jgi:hypothetical protein